MTNQAQGQGCCALRAGVLPYLAGWPVAAQRWRQCSASQTALKASLVQSWRCSGKCGQHSGASGPAQEPAFQRGG